MLPLEENGVVDASLNVHGMVSLEIADLSITPRNVGAHINNMALTNGEKAAKLFIEEFGLGKYSRHDPSLGGNIIP